VVGYSSYLWMQCGYYETWVALGMRGQAMLDFAHDTPIFVPSKVRLPQTSSDPKYIVNRRPHVRIGCGRCKNP
jgi:hypothetical protein